MTLNEVAPPTKKHERMVKHIKKSYGKKGGLSDEEKSIAYATAWKNYNKKESFGFEIDKGEHKKASKKSKMRNLAKGNTNPNEKAAAEKKAGGPKLMGEEGMTYQEAIDAGWEMSGEGIWIPPQTESIEEKKSWKDFKNVLTKRKKKEEKKPEKAQDAGAKARRAMKRREHAKYVSGSEDNVPDDIRD